MNRRNLQFNALRAFEAAARHSSVSGAARELSVTHSAVSHQLRRLEQDLGVTLFKRSNRGLSITAAGEALAPVLIECFDRISAALNELRELDGDDGLQITSTPTFATKWLVPRLGDWYHRADASRVNLHPTLDFLELGADRGIDIAIRCGIPPWQGMRHELLMPIHLVPVCSPAYARRHPRLHQPADLLQLSLLHADVGDHGTGEEWRDWLDAAGVECPRKLPGLSFHDPALAMQAAADGLGLAIGYLELIDDDLRSGRLAIAFDLPVRHRYSYYLLQSNEDNEEPAYRSFCDWIRSQAGLS